MRTVLGASRLTFDLVSNWEFGKWPAIPRGKNVYVRTPTAEEQVTGVVR